MEPFTQMRWLNCLVATAAAATRTVNCFPFLKQLRKSEGMNKELCPGQMNNRREGNNRKKDAFLNLCYLIALTQVVTYNHGDCLSLLTKEREGNKTWEKASSKFELNHIDMVSSHIYLVYFLCALFFPSRFYEL